jgi:hypothetical protein
MFNMPEILDMLSSDIALHSVSKTLLQGEIVGSKFYWFPQSFETFLEELCK